MSVVKNAVSNSNPAPSSPKTLTREKVQLKFNATKPTGILSGLHVLNDEGESDDDVIVTQGKSVPVSAGLDAKSPAKTSKLSASVLVTKIASETKPAIASETKPVGTLPAAAPGWQLSAVVAQRKAATANPSKLPAEDKQSGTAVKSNVTMPAKIVLDMFTPYQMKTKQPMVKKADLNCVNGKDWKLNGKTVEHDVCGEQLIKPQSITLRLVFLGF